MSALTLISAARCLLGVICLVPSFIKSGQIIIGNAISTCLVTLYLISLVVVFKQNLISDYLLSRVIATTFQNFSRKKGHCNHSDFDNNLAAALLFIQI